MRNHVQFSEILSTINKTGLKGCLFGGKVEYCYDGYCRGYLLNINSGSLTIPRTARDALQLVFPYLLLQVFIYKGKLLTLEFGITDSDSMKRRLIFTQGKEIIKNAMHARIPNGNITRNQWINLCIDLNSIFNLCFPTHSYRSLDSIHISGTLKLRKLISLMFPASELLPSISEAPKFAITLQELDSSAFPKPRPLYFSNSPAKVNKQYHYNPRNNIFKKQLESLKELNGLKRQYMKASIVGPRVNFRSPEKKFQEEDEEEEEKYKRFQRKITHNNSRNMVQYEDEVEESIEADKKSYIDLVASKPIPRGFDSPEYYLGKISQLCQVRHFTPPFVNSKDNITYNPIDRYYNNLE